MKLKKPLITVKLFVPIGLLLVVLPTVLKDISIVLPDFFRGTLMGLGIALEIIGVVMLLKSRNSAGKTTEPGSEI